MTYNHHLEDQKQHHYDQDHHHNDYNRHTEPGVLPSKEIMERIAAVYLDNISPQLTAAAAHIIEDALQAGMDADTVILAIEETGLAPRPSAFYLRAILRNWAMSGECFSRVHDVSHPINCDRWWTVTRADIRARMRSPQYNDDQLAD